VSSTREARRRDGDAGGESRCEARGTRAARPTDSTRRARRGRDWRADGVGGKECRWWLSCWFFWC